MRSSPSPADGGFGRNWGSATRSGPRSAAPQKTELSRSNALILMAIGYFQPITRGELSQFLGREVSRDAIAALRGEGFIAAGPRSPTPGAPYAYVTTPGFLAHFGFESLRDLPDIEKLEDAGLLGRTSEATAQRRCVGVRAERGAGADGRRRRAGGGCGVVETDAGGRRSAMFGVQRQVPKSNSRRRSQRRQCRGSWFESPQLAVVSKAPKSRDLIKR